MLIPKKQKYKKRQKGKRRNKICVCSFLETIKKKSLFLKAVESGRVSSKQLNSSFQIINKRIKKRGKILLRVFPQLPVSKKPVEVRMGKGKGAVNSWISKVQAGTVLFEVCITPSTQVIEALELAKLRLPIRTKIFYRLR